MCGIFGYVGPQDPVKIVLEGLRKLEYRGYDSAGIAGIKEHAISYCKEVGNISHLEKKTQEMHLSLDLAIAQTRWATHGKPSRVNAHPHFDTKHALAVVHNGIIENHSSLRKMLEAKGALFVSDTDSEVIAHLVADFYEGDLLKAVQQALPLLKGAYAIAMIHRDFPGHILGAALHMPLVMGRGHHEMFLSSDPQAFGKQTKEVIFLADGEVAVIEAADYQIYDSLMAPITKKTEMLMHQAEEMSKGDFEHYTLKEIFDQPQSIKNALSGRCLEDYGTAIFEEITFETQELLNVERLLIVACGTSWHAGCVGGYLFEDMARIPTQVEIASEFRYRNPIILPGTLVIAISQSGETADTLAAVRELKAKGAPIIALCNVAESSLAREANQSLLLRAGLEVGVCSTKAFTNQVVVLALFALMMARMRNLGRAEGKIFLHALMKMPEQVEQVLNQAEEIRNVAHRFAGFDNFFFLGRRYMYPAALEGALKLKEISYINANGYPAGEMKHGPIALISEDCPTVALCANIATLEKMHSNLMEVKSRNGLVVAVVEEGVSLFDDIADAILRVPKTVDELSVIPATVVTQLFAYFIAKKRGLDIDRPRNLAKSVTVE